jgi:hypothetical protein
MQVGYRPPMRIPMGMSVPPPSMPPMGMPPLSIPPPPMGMPPPQFMNQHQQQQQQQQQQQPSQHQHHQYPQQQTQHQHHQYPQQQTQHPYQNMPQIPGQQPGMMMMMPGQMDSGFDGKMLRKTIARKTVDYNPSCVRYLEDRIWKRDQRDERSLQADPLYTPHMTLPQGMIDNPVNCVMTKFIRAALNKDPRPIFCVCVSILKFDLLIMS